MNPVIDAMRVFALDYLPDTAVWTRDGQSSVDALGGTVTTSQPVGRVKCRVAPIRGTVAVDAERVAPKATTVVYVPVKYAVQPGDTLTFSSRSFIVTTAEAAGPSSLYNRLFCTERV